MILLLISSLEVGGKEKRFTQLNKLLDESEILNKKIIFKNLNHRKKIKYLDLLYNIISLYKIFFKYKPRIIHSWSNYLTIISYPYCVLNSVKLIDSSISTNGKDGSFLFKLIRKTAILLSNFITVNSLSAAINLKLKNKFYLIKNAVSKNVKIKFIKNKYRVKNIFFVSRMEKGKRVDLFIESSIKINKKYPDINFKIIGDGKNLTSYKKKYDNISHVSFLGHQPNFIDKLSYGDIGVLISDSEGTPNVLLEFMSRGVPSLYYNLDTHIDSPIINNLTGYNVHSLKEYTNKLILLIENENLYKLFCENSIIHARKNYNLNKNFKSYITLYNSIWN